MKTQKESVFGAVTSLGFDGAGEFKPTKDQLKEIYQIVSDEIVAGDVAFSDDAKVKYNTPELIRSKYVPGMVSNWIRKDTRLNGGEKYETKNPGSRAGRGDEVLKNLKGLRGTLSDAEQIAAVDVEITNRTNELNAAKASKKSVQVDLSKIPDDIRQRLGL